MSTLTTCVRRAGDSINPADVEEVTLLRDEYIKDGLTGAEAAAKATQDVIDMINGERNEVLATVREQNGIVPGEPRVQRGQVRLSVAKKGDQPAFMTVTDGAIRRANRESVALDLDDNSINNSYYSRMLIDDFLDLTTNDKHSADDILTEGPAESKVGDVVNKEFFDPAEVDRDDQYAIPYLSIRDNMNGMDGSIVAHEGRHRAALLKQDGATTMPVHIEIANVAEVMDGYGNDTDISDVGTLIGQSDSARKIEAPQGIMATDKNFAEIKKLIGEDSYKQSNISSDIRFSLNRDQRNVMENHPDSDQAKSINLSTVINDIRESGVNLATSIKNGDIVDANMDKVLKAVPMRYLQDFAPESMKSSVSRFSELASEMDARKNELHEQFAEKMNTFQKFMAKHPQALKAKQLMFDTTLAGVDPSKAYTPVSFFDHWGNEIKLESQLQFKAAEGVLLAEIRTLNNRAKLMARDRSNTKEMEKKSEYTRSLSELRNKWAQEQSRKRAYPEMVNRWNELDQESQDSYNMVRDTFQGVRDEEDAALMQRLTDLMGDADEVVMRRIDRMKLNFERNKVEDPYFRLQRFGDFWVASYNEDGSTESFMRFEHIKDWRAQINQLDQEGVQHRSGRRFETANKADIDPEFTADVVTQVEGLGTAASRDLAEAIWQQHLARLPEVSIRQQQMHRKKRAGFSEDMVRVLSHTVFHGSNQIAKLEFSGKMEAALGQINDDVSKAQFDSSQSLIATTLQDELKNRLSWVRNPKSSNIATRLTQSGFIWYLGVTPAAALVNMSQTALVAFPVISAKYGAGSTMNALLTAGKQAFRRGGIEKVLEGDEHKAYEEFHKRGLLTKTQAHDLAGVSEHGEDYNSRMTKVMEIVSTPFHRAEVWNREATAMAAYRLSKADGMTHDQAMQEAADLTWMSHFDYANSNRPTYMQNDVAKVLFLFKQYSLNMSYRLMRDFHDWRKAASPEDRAEAGKRLGGILGMTSLLAGATGMPLFTVTMAMANALIGDEDDPFDAESEMRASLTEVFGAKGSEFIMNGAVNAGAGVDISSRVSLNNLWMRDPTYDLEGRSLWQHYVMEAMGPVFKMGESFAEGAKLISEEHHARGLETMLPKVGRDAMKAIRFNNEGALTRRGDAILDQDQFNAKDVVTQAIGFTPAKLTLQYEQNNAFKRAEQRIKNRRSFLLNKYALALRFDDVTDLRNTRDAIRAYNKATPRYPITPATIRRSMSARRRMNRGRVSGLNLDKNLRYLTEELNFVE